MDLGNGWTAALRSGSVEPSKGTPALLSRDAVFLLDFLRLMADCRTDFTDTWRALMEVPALSVALKSRDFLELRMRAGARVEPSTGSNGVRTVDPGLGEDGNWACDSSDGEAASKSHGNMEGWDDECLQPLAAILARAKPSRKQRRQWAQWIRQYMARIDTQASSKSSDCKRVDGDLSERVVHYPTFRF